MTINLGNLVFWTITIRDIFEVACPTSGFARNQRRKKCRCEFTWGQTLERLFTSYMLLFVFTAGTRLHLRDERTNEKIVRLQTAEVSKLKPGQYSAAITTSLRSFPQTQLVLVSHEWERWAPLAFFFGFRGALLVNWQESRRTYEYPNAQDI